MRHNPFDIVTMFEETVADYTGAPYAVSTDNCTDALLICCEYLKVEDVTIPSKTYLSVPQSIMHAGGTVKFRDYLWNGVYQLEVRDIQGRLLESRRESNQIRIELDLKGNAGIYFLSLIDEKGERANFKVVKQ